MKKPSRLIRQGWNFAQVQAAVFLSPDLTHADVRLYCYLQWRAGHRDHAWPSVVTMAADLHMSEQAVRLSLRHLIEHDWIRRSRNYGQSSDTFVFETQELCREYDARSANRLAHDPLTGERMNRSPVSRLNDSHLTRVIELANGKSSRSRERPAERALLTLFTELTGIREPPAKSDKERRAAAARWYQPLRRMAALAGDAAPAVLRRAVAKMRADGLTISAPQSVEQVFIACQAAPAAEPDAVAVYR